MSGRHAALRGGRPDAPRPRRNKEGPVHAAPREMRKGPVSLILLELASFSSACANGLVLLAMPWLVLDRTGSAGYAGVIAAATTLPMLFSALLSGTLVDLVGRRRTAMLADVLSALSVAAIPLLDHILGFDLLWLAALCIIGSVFDLAGVTGRKAMLPAAAERAGWRLEKANGVHESVNGLALMAAPGIGGLLIAWGSSLAALTAAATASVVALVLETILRLPSEPEPQTGRGVGIRTTLSRLTRGSTVGASIVYRDRLLRVVWIIGSILFMVYMPIANVVLPAYFHDLGEPGRLGLLSVTMAVGGIVGSVCYGFWGHAIPRRRLFCGSVIAASGGLFLMSWLPPYYLMIGCAILIGFAYGPISPLMNLATQCRSTEATRGRVIGIMISAAYVAGPIGYLAAGPIVQRLGPERSFVLLASTLCVMVVISCCVPALRQFNALEIPEDDIPPPPGSPSTPKAASPPPAHTTEPSFAAAYEPPPPWAEADQAPTHPAVPVSPVDGVPQR